MTFQETSDLRDDPYWNLRLTWIELILLALAFVIILLLHLQPVLQSQFAIPLTVLLAAMCYLTPVTGFLFIACSQYLPFPEEATLNPSQIGFLVWLPAVLFRYSRVQLTGLWRLWPVLPCLIWYMLMTGEKIYLPENNYFKALCYAMIACQLANEARGQYLKCLFGLCLGATLIMCAYWADRAGLQIQLSDWGTSREGIARMGGTRADAVMVWPALLIGLAGLIGLQLALGWRRSKQTSPGWLTSLTVILSAASLPVLVSTMTQGAILAFGLLSAVVVATLGQGLWRGHFTPRLVRGSIIFAVAAPLFGFACYAFDLFSIRTKVQAMEDYYRQEASEAGVFTSRNDVWAYSIRTILKYPIFGVVNSEEPEDIPPEYSDNPEGYVSHNVFLDYGRTSGMVGMAFAALFFFFPVMGMCLGGEWMRYLPFLLTHVAMFIFWMSLSFVHYKTFWAFWILATMAATSRAKENSRRRPKHSYAKPQELLTGFQQPRPPAIFGE
jgi:hypothetical protein